MLSGASCFREHAQNGFLLGLQLGVVQDAQRAPLMPVRSPLNLGQLPLDRLRESSLNLRVLLGADDDRVWAHRFTRTIVPGRPTGAFGSLLSTASSAARAEV